MSRCGIVILAAGASTRMGLAKQSLEFEGSTLLLRAVQTALASPCRPIVVVLGANAQLLHPLVRDHPVQVVLNPDWSQGMGTSIRAGVEAVAAHPLDALMILLCDQPLIHTQALDQMWSAHLRANKPITAASYAGALGTPVIFSSTHFAELCQLQPHQGGKTVLQRHPHQVHPFPLPEAAIDVDTPDDYQTLLNHHSSPPAP
jgi:molybdenum cofactor cytidylyltransferase